MFARNSLRSASLMGRVVLLRCVTTISCSSQFIARPAKQCLRVCPHHTAITRKCLHALSAPNHGQSQQTNTPTLSYLDLVLGSKDDEKVAVEVESGQDAADTTVLRVPSWAWRELREPRVVPIASNVLYYLLLLVGAPTTEAANLLVEAKHALVLIPWLCQQLHHDEQPAQSCCIKHYQWQPHQPWSVACL